jgi:hypothetical protein
MVLTMQIILKAITKYKQAKYARSAPCIRSVCDPEFLFATAGTISCCVATKKFQKSGSASSDKFSMTL